MSSPHGDRRWPFDALIRFVASGRPLHPPDMAQRCAWCSPAKECVGHEEVALAVGVSGRTVDRWVRAGLTDRRADHAATALDTHPSLIWGPEWFHVIEPETAEQKAGAA